MRYGNEQFKYSKHAIVDSLGREPWRFFINLYFDAKSRKIKSINNMSLSLLFLRIT